DENIMNEEVLEKIMMGVAIAGNSKSLGKEALSHANRGDFPEARKILLEAKKSFLEIHNSHFELIQKEASGEKLDISLLLIHMEDHVMTTSLFLETLEEQINLVERVYKLEQRFN
ncbi:MAG: PTS lactose/cellobiose transporter subunit IIA, partial [Fusobacteriaceae bacterium]